MKLTLRPLVALAAVSLLVAAGVTHPGALGAVADTPGPIGTPGLIGKSTGENAVWLGHGFMVSPAAVATMPELPNAYAPSTYARSL